MLFCVILISRGNTKIKDSEMHGKKAVLCCSRYAYRQTFELGLVGTFVISYQKYVSYTK